MIPDVSTLPEGEVFTMTRRFRATLPDLWALWTTARGIERWWGPPGFAVTVQSIDLRTGGQLHYTMTAHQPEMVAFMQANGMPVSTPSQVTYGEVTPLKRLAYSHLVDFVPGQTPYSTALAVEFHAEGDTSEMQLTFQRMHDAEWSERQRMGWDLELGKLADLLGGAI
ncbi:MAG: SRPBCC domain-containing protein [bacterium]